MPPGLEPKEKEQSTSTTTSIENVEPGKEGTASSRPASQTERELRNKLKIGHIKKRFFPIPYLTSSKIHWYAWDKENGAFTRLSTKVTKGAKIVSAKKVLFYDDFLWITVLPKGKDKEPQSGYVRRTNLKIKGSIKSVIHRAYVDPYNLIAPYGDAKFQESKSEREYIESNFEWYLNLAILMDAYRSLENTENDTENDKDVEQTRRDIALAALQGFFKTASIRSPKTVGDKPEFKNRATKPQEGTRHKEYMGIQSTPFYDDGGYYRSATNPNLFKDLNDLLKEKMGITKSTVRAVSDPFVMEAIKREFPLIYPETTTKPEQVNTVIESEQSFNESIEVLRTNIKKGCIPNNNFVFDLSKYYESNKENEAAHSPELIINNFLTQTLINTIKEEPDQKNRNLLIVHLYRKIKCLAVTNFEGINVLIEFGINDACTKIDKLYKEDKKDTAPTLDTKVEVNTIDGTLMYSGTRIDPIGAKEAMLKLDSFENILEKRGILPVTFASKPLEENDNNPRDIGERVKARLLSKKLIGEDAASKVNTYTGINDFIGSSIFKEFRALSATENAAPYVKIYSTATTDLIGALQDVSKEGKSIDDIFKEKGITNLLRTLCVLMEAAMEAAIFVADNITLFLNQIDKLHNYLQTILAIVKPYRQDTVFLDSITNALRRPPLQDQLIPTPVEPVEESITTSIPETRHKEVEDIPETKHKEVLDTSKKKKVGANLFAMIKNGAKKLKTRIGKKPVPVPVVPVAIAESVAESKDNKINEKEEPKSIVASPTSIPDDFNPLVHHQASAMHALSSTLSGVEQQKGGDDSDELNVLVLKDNYYEAIGSKGYKGLAQRAEKYNTHTWDGKALDGEGVKSGEKENPKTDKSNKKIGLNKPEKGFDVYVCDFHHNISATREEYDTEDLMDQVSRLYKGGYFADKFTIAIDCTIDYIRSKDVQVFLETHKGLITSGVMNVVLYRSAQKFDMLGLDNYYGGYTITINDSKSFDGFNDRIEQTADHVPGLAHQGLTHLVSYGSDHIDMYKEALMKSTERFYNKLVAAGLDKKGKKDNIIYIAKNKDPNAVFIDIRSKGAEVFGQRMERWAGQYSKRLQKRPSFGFPVSNITYIPGPVGKPKRVRFNPGLESTEEVDEYAHFFIAYRELVDKNPGYAGSFSMEAYKAVNQRINELKEQPQRFIEYIEIDTPIPLDELSSDRIAQLYTMLSARDEFGVVIDQTDQEVVQEALKQDYKTTLSQYTITKRKNGYVIEHISQDVKSVDKPRPSFTAAPEDFDKPKRPKPKQPKPESGIRKRQFNTKNKNKDGSNGIGLVERLTKILDNAPLVKVNKKAVDPTLEDWAVINNENLGESETETKSKKVIKAKREYVTQDNWKIIENRGGGDCLFLALTPNGKDDNKAQELRTTIAEYHRDNDDIIKPEFVAAELSRMLASSSNTRLNNLEESAKGKASIPNEAYSLVLAIPGIWGGRPEIQVYSKIEKKRVFVMENHGLITQYINGVESQKDGLPEGVFNDKDTIVLYKTPNHWRRVSGRKPGAKVLTELEGKSSLKPKLNDSTMLSKLSSNQKNKLLDRLNNKEHRVSFQPEGEYKKVIKALREEDNKKLSQYTITSKGGEVFVIDKI